MTAHLSHDPILAGDHDYKSVTRKIADVPLAPRLGKGWLAGFGLAFSLLMVMMMSITVLLTYGVGVWGLNVPVAWGFAIINFGWWIGIGHAGTLISAILLLFRQEWRTSINRFAEAMTLFAVSCAGLFPLLHLGRIWKFFYLMPHPNTLELWPQWRSPLVWDVFAVSTYGAISAVFWYIGLVPDLATLRDRATHPALKMIYGLFALGWRNSARHWHRYQMSYLLLAGLATPLVISVHTIVSFDFSVSILPGWHATIFPPYFVAGAVFAGFAMVLTLVIPLRAAYKWHDMITDRHLENMGKILLVTGLIVVYGYSMEAFTAWYSANPYEQFMMKNRMWGGPYAPMYWALILCNATVPQLMWFKACRRNVYVLFMVAMFVNTGMWLERYVIVITSLHRDALPSSWGMYSGTFWDWTLYIGTLGLFVTMLFLFVRILPAISMFEMRELVWHHGKHEEAGGVADAEVHS